MPPGSAIVVRNRISWGVLLPYESHGCRGATRRSPFYRNNGLIGSGKNPGLPGSALPLNGTIRHLTVTTAGQLEGRPYNWETGSWRRCAGTAYRAGGAMPSWEFSCTGRRLPSRRSRRSMPISASCCSPAARMRFPDSPAAQHHREVYGTRPWIHPGTTLRLSARVAGYCPSGRGRFHAPLHGLH